MGIGKDEVGGKRRGRKGIEAGNGGGGGSIDCAARSQALPSTTVGVGTGGGQMDPRLRATGAGQESSSSLIPQERKLRDILVSVPPKRGKGTSPLFLRPTFRPRRALPWILLSVTLSCLLWSTCRYAVSEFPPNFPTISPSPLQLFHDKRCYGVTESRTKFGTFFFVHFFRISPRKTLVFKLIRAIHLGAIIKKNLVQFHPFRNRSEIESSMRDTLDHYLKSGKDFRNAMLRRDYFLRISLL